LSLSSVVRKASLVTGTPFDLEVTTHKGLETLELVNDVTVVDAEWLQELAPDEFNIRPGKLRFDAQTGMMALATVVKFGKKTFQAASKPIREHTNKNELLFVDLYSDYAQERLKREREMFEMFYGRRVPDISWKMIRDRVRTVAMGAVSLGELPPEQQTELDQLGHLETWLGAAYHLESKLTAGEAVRRGRRGHRPNGLPGRDGQGRHGGSGRGRRGR
jgi:hypothetical protein